MSSQLNLLQQYDRIIGGLQILAKYGEQSTSAEHDVIYAGPSFSRSFIAGSPRLQPWEECVKKRKTFDIDETSQ